MNFGKNLLEKYGWKEGDGLGKNSDGIAKPLRANLKFDTAGLGVDKGAEFTNNWWERMYSEASKNISVNNENGTCNIEAKVANSFEITTKPYSFKNEGPYGNFVQRATILSSGHEMENPDMVDIQELPKFKALTDEELFSACGGRTAHKAARHGLKLSGKLARIEEQERQFLNKITTSESSPEKLGLTKKEKKKLKKRNSTSTNDEDTMDCLDAPEKKKKSKCDRIEDLQQECDYNLLPKKKKKSKHTKCDNIQDAPKDYDVTNDSYKTKNAKSKKKKKSELTECSISIKKKKKDKNGPTLAQVNEFLNDGESVGLAEHIDHKKLHAKQKDSDIYLKESSDNTIKYPENKKKKKAKKLKKDLKIITKNLERLEPLSLCDTLH